MESNNSSPIGIPHPQYASPNKRILDVRIPEIHTAADTNDIILTTQSDSAGTVDDTKTLVIVLNMTSKQQRGLVFSPEAKYMSGIRYTQIKSKFDEQGLIEFRKTVS